jgi:3-oxoacyl-[acyl-carrier-protein] synthase III
MNAFIRSAGAYVLKNKDTHADLEKRVNTTDKRTSSQSRIRKTLLIEPSLIKKHGNTVIFSARIFRKRSPAAIAGKKLVVIH